MIGGATKLVALLGQPVAESLSPRMQNAAFAARGLDWAYVPLEVEPARLGAAVDGLVAGGYAGANVTIPHKQAVVELCDEADGESINTLLFRAGRVLGFKPKPVRQPCDDAPLVDASTRAVHTARAVLSQGTVSR